MSLYPDETSTPAVSYEATADSADLSSLEADDGFVEIPDVDDADVVPLADGDPGTPAPAGYEFDEDELESDGEESERVDRQAEGEL